MIYLLLCNISFVYVYDISDIENLKEIARTHLDYSVRLKAVERIHDEEFLRDISFEYSSLNVQIACADNLIIQSL